MAQASDDKNLQIALRVTAKLNSRIERAARLKGLTKASWLRQLAIRELDNANAN